MLNGWLLLTLAVAASTVLWPVGRWGLHGNGRATVMGFWISVTMGAVSVIGWLSRGSWVIPPQVWVAAALLGIAYAVGFCTLIMHCLKIGPAGPTVTINNLAMACGVLYDVLVLHPQGVPDWRVLAGALGTCFALVLIGMRGRDPTGNSSVASSHAHSAREDRGNTGDPPTKKIALTPGLVPRAWYVMVMIGGAFSGLSFITQTHVGRLFPAHSFAYLAIGSCVSALILLPVLLREPKVWRHSRERLAGLTIGAVSSTSMLVTLAAFKYFSSAVVLPVTVVTPVVLVLLIGHFVYREHLGRGQTIGSIIAVISLMLLSIGSA
jgi:drug/metabolite transporter (DMT)-like permease